MVNIKRTLIRDINKQICLGIPNNLLILPVSVHKAIAIITPAKIKITTSLKLQIKRIVVSKANFYLQSLSQNYYIEMLLCHK